ncbi:arsenate reductase (glutaredoxin) [Spongiibacter marinus]|uniref:arsenate reductase (glutaredoxin) n=1 Tax=Spongiibacter marinus TaxID=354246 RepID=UPI0035699BFD
MSVYTLYHNPRCSKSRQTKQLLEDNGITPEVVLYLEDSPSADTLRDLLAKLGISPRQLLRKGEAEYKERGLADDSLSDEALIQAMVEAPKLIERPIVVKGDQAVLGRPPENVLALLD